MLVLWWLSMKWCSKHYIITMIVSILHTPQLCGEHKLMVQRGVCVISISCFQVLSYVSMNQFPRKLNNDNIAVVGFECATILLRVENTNRYVIRARSISPIIIKVAFCPRLNMNYKCWNRFQFLLFGHKYTLSDNLICKIVNFITHGNTEGILLTCSVVMVFLLN